MYEKGYLIPSFYFIRTHNSTEIFKQIVQCWQVANPSFIFKLSFSKDIDTYCTIL